VPEGIDKEYARDCPQDGINLQYGVPHIRRYSTKDTDGDNEMDVRICAIYNINMAKSKERIRAKFLRNKGWSIRSIAEELKVSKASVSLWCRDIVLTEKQIQLLTEKGQQGARRGQLLGAAVNRKKKEDSIARYRRDAQNELCNLTPREILLAGLGIYWGEGIKGKGTVAVANSDPRVISFMLHWFRSMFGVPKEMFRPQIFINDAHRPREKIVRKFWSTLLDIPDAQFRKVVFIKVRNKKVYENHDSYYGVLALRVRRGTSLKYRVLGYLDALGAQYSRPT